MLAVTRRICEIFISFFLLIWNYAIPVYLSLISAFPFGLFRMASVVLGCFRALSDFSGRMEEVVAPAGFEPATYPL